MQNSTKEGIVQAIKDKQSPHKILKKFKIVTQQLMRIRDELYPVDGQKIYPIGYNEAQELKQQRSMSNYQTLTMFIASLSKGDIVSIKQKLYNDREHCGEKNYTAEVVQTNKTTVFVRASSRVECFNVGELANGDVKIFKSGVSDT